MRQTENGAPVGDVRRHIGASEATFCVWTHRYAHLGVSELRCPRLLEDESARLTALIAARTLDMHLMQETLRGHR